MTLYNSSNHKLIYKRCALFWDGDLLCYLTHSKILLFLSMFRYFVRLFRIEPRCCVPIGDSLFLLAFRKKIYEVSIKEKRIINITNCRNGFSTPLNLCTLLPFSKNEVYWGDYGPNLNLEPINIYKYEKGKEPTICYTFPANSIKHVHNILFDNVRNRFFIFTGDFGEKVGIYISNIDFSEVKPYLIGDEKYRAVVGMVIKNGLLWATDAVMHDNYLFYSPFDNKNNIEIISKLNGSVIYGIEINEGLLFSTTVEPFPSSKSRILSLLDNRLGPGIKNRNVDVIFVKPNFSLYKISQFSKDILPMRLFQYGQVIFPYVDKKTNYDEVICSPVSVKKWDGKGYRITLN